MFVAIMLLSCGYYSIKTRMISDVKRLPVGVRTLMTGKLDYSGVRYYRESIAKAAHSMYSVGSSTSASSNAFLRARHEEHWPQ